MDKSGKAGNHGGNIRSDCLVSLELTSGGGIQLDLRSKVGILYGTSIRNRVEAVMDHFDVRNARILIEDSGALDFVLAARLEAAVLKATGRTGSYLLPENQDIRKNDQKTGKDGQHTPKENQNLPVDHPAPDGRRSRFRLTRLYLPGNTPSMMINAGIHRPDGVILDLEDSVALEKKMEARILVRNALRALNFYGAERMVRINQLPEGIRDLGALSSNWPELILVPKVEGPGQIQAVEKEILKLGGNAASVLLMPILESAMGIEKAFEIAVSSKNIVAMAIGLEDYAADLGVRRTEEGNESLYARSRMVNACRAAGIQAIDSVYADVDNEAGLRKTVLQSRSMGFEGMGCIHPRQIPVIREAFQPTAGELDKAKKIVRAFDHAEKQGIGVVSLGSKMIDPPVVKGALRTLNLAIRMNLIPENWREEDETS
jgi:citrate lyase subunit beta/citryl-CoA lyase